VVVVVEQVLAGLVAGGERGRVDPAAVLAAEAVVGLQRSVDDLPGRRPGHRLGARGVLVYKVAPARRSATTRWLRLWPIAGNRFRVGVVIA
jgi:hypothetical protein